MPTKSFSYQGYSIPYTDTGKGTILVLLHGFAETGNIWKHQVSFLKNHYRVVVPEIPDTSWQKEQIADRNMASSIEAMADAAAALIKSLANEPIILLGHSMGGYVTLAVAEQYPSLLKAFGLIHSTAFAETD